MIDSHAHIWRLGEHGCVWPTPDLQPIFRNFTLEDLRDAVGGDGHLKVLLVQSQEDDGDTDWLLSLVADPIVAGVVGWCDFECPTAAERIETLASSPAVRGLRPMVQDREADWYDAPQLDRCFNAMEAAGLVLDALIRPRHLRSLQRLAERCPNLQIVIDHGAKPDFTDLIEWKHRMLEIAELPNVACKLSGLLTELPPGATPNAIEPAYDILWSAFGPDRLLWGSDWPVLNLVGSYDSWLSQAIELVPEDHHSRVFDSNARRIYGI